MGDLRSEEISQAREKDERWVLSKPILSLVRLCACIATGLACVRDKPHAMSAPIAVCG